MQGLDPGDAMDDSAADEAPEDDEVRTTPLPRRLLALAVTVGLSIVGCWSLVVVSVAEEAGWPESVLG